MHLLLCEASYEGGTRESVGDKEESRTVERARAAVLEGSRWSDLSVQRTSIVLFKAYVEEVPPDKQIQQQQYVQTKAEMLALSQPQKALKR